MAYELSGLMANPAAAAAMLQVANTPQFAQLVAQQAGAIGMSAPSVGGPGVAYGGQPMVQHTAMTAVRELAIGLKQAGIAANGGSFNVTARPQVLFRGERLVVPEVPGYPGQSSTNQCDIFEINDVKIGNKSQLVSGENSLSARTFAETAVGVRLSLDSAQIAQDVVVAVTNFDPNSAATFRCTVFGTSSF